MPWEIGFHQGVDLGDRGQLPGLDHRPLCRQDLCARVPRGFHHVDDQGGAGALHRAGVPAVEQDGQPEPVGGAPAARMDGTGAGPAEEDPAESEVSRVGNLATL